MSNNCDNNNNNDYLHYRYVIFILVLALVSIFSYYFCGNDELVKTISFAGTLASIILSVLAIFITVLSNDSLSSMIHKIHDLYEAIKDIPSTIDNSITSLTSSTRQLRDNMNELNAFLPELKAEMSKVDEHIKENNEAIKALSSQQVSETENSINKNESIKIDEFFKFYLQGCSFIGLCLIYLLYVTAEKKKSISLAEYCQKIDVNSSIQYDFGFYIACRATGLFLSDLSPDEKFVIFNVAFAKKISKEDIVNALRQSSTMLDNENFNADEYITKIDNFVNDEGK